MNAWRCFLDSLSTDGGHIFLLFVLLLVGVTFFKFDNTAGGQIISMSIGALFAVLKITGSNREQIAKTPLPTERPIQPPPAA